MVVPSDDLVMELMEWTFLHGRGRAQDKLFGSLQRKKTTDRSIDHPAAAPLTSHVDWNLDLVEVVCRFGFRIEGAVTRIEDEIEPQRRKFRIFQNLMKGRISFDVGVVQSFLNTSVEFLF